MKISVHKALDRGYANHGWLKTYHSFSFANYYNPKNMNFGALRVLNDDDVAPKMGFGKHPHQNMEIITIPLDGELTHGDDMGNKGIIEKGDIQVMSAGTGVTHSEENGSDTQHTKFLQIWIFPNKQNVKPRYDQINALKTVNKEEWKQLVSPYPDDEGVWIHQDAWLQWGEFSKNTSQKYSIKKEGNGSYIFVLEGEVKIGEEVLTKRDAMGIWETHSIDIEIKENATVLVIDVPMNF